MNHGMAMMGHRQEHPTFQVFDGPLKLDAAPNGFTTDLLSGISKKHGPSLGQNALR